MVVLLAGCGLRHLRLGARPRTGLCWMPTSGSAYKLSRLAAWRSQVDVPNAEDREAILHKQLTGMAHSLTEAEIHSIAEDCQAFVGADLKCLCSFAALTAVKEAAGALGYPQLAASSGQLTGPPHRQSSQGLASDPLVRSSVGAQIAEEYLVRVEFGHFVEALRHVK